MAEELAESLASTATPESASTPASVQADTAETPITTQSDERDIPQSADDVWNEVKSDEPVKEEAPAEVTETAEKPEPKSDEPIAKTEEELLLEEAFASEEKASPFDRDKVIEAQPSRRSKAWMKSTFEKADIVEAFTSDKPIGEVTAKLKELSPQRYEEFQKTSAESFVDTTPEAAFQRAYVVKMLEKDSNFDYTKAKIPTLDEVINGTPKVESSETSPDTSELDQYYDFDWRDPANDGNFLPEELAAIKQIRALEADNKAKIQADAEKDSQIKSLEERLNEIEGGFKTEKEQKLEEVTRSTVNDYRAKTQAKLQPYIEKNTGLGITETDIPEVKALKSNLLELYTGTEYDRANDLPSDFEDFALRQSSVAPQMKAIYARVTQAQQKQADALVSGKSADAEKFAEIANSETATLLELFAVANKEFKAKRITPIMTVLEMLSKDLTIHNDSSSQRIESVNGSQTRQTAIVKDAADAQGVWDNAVEEVLEQSRLRAA